MGCKPAEISSAHLGAPFLGEVANSTALGSKRTFLLLIAVMIFSFVGVVNSLAASSAFVVNAVALEMGDKREFERMVCVVRDECKRITLKCYKPAIAGDVFSCTKHVVITCPSVHIDKLSAVLSVQDFLCAYGVPRAGGNLAAGISTSRSDYATTAIGRRIIKIESERQYLIADMAHRMNAETSRWRIAGVFPQRSYPPIVCAILVSYPIGVDGNRDNEGSRLDTSAMQLQIAKPDQSNGYKCENCPVVCVNKSPLTSKKDSNTIFLRLILFAVVLVCGGAAYAALIGRS